MPSSLLPSSVLLCLASAAAPAGLEPDVAFPALAKLATSGIRSACGAVRARFVNLSRTHHKSERDATFCCPFWSLLPNLCNL